MTVIERWVTVCPKHGVSYHAASKPPTGGCEFWSTDDEHCREAVEVVRLTNDTGAVSRVTLLEAALLDACDGDKELAAQHLQRADAPYSGGQ